MKPLKQKSYGSIPHLLGSRLGVGDHHCHEGQQHRHGRPGHGRRRGPGHVQARADWPQRGAARQRRD